MRTTRGLIATIIFLVIGVLIGGLIMYFGAKNMPGFFAQETETTHSKVVKAVQAEEQVVLMSQAIEGITESRRQAQLFGRNVPFTDRTSFIQYSYKAKLGLEGKEVTIDEVGQVGGEAEAAKYLITVPEFVFIGHSDEQFRTAVEDNGILSWTTDDIDAAALVTDILNDDRKQQSIDDNREFLEQQAESFYGAIVKSVDPEAEVEFAFAG